MARAPFPDDNLALAVLLGLFREELVPRPDWPALKRAHPSADHQLNQSLRDALVSSVRDHSEQIARVKAVAWSTVPDVIRESCWPAWDGESNDFDINSLEGIEQCLALERLDLALAARLEDADLRRLLQLPALAEVRLSQEIPADLFEALSARGVEVLGRAAEVAPFRTKKFVDAVERAIEAIALVVLADHPDPGPNSRARLKLAEAVVSRVRSVLEDAEVFPPIDVRAAMSLVSRLVESDGPSGSRKAELTTALNFLIEVERQRADQTRADLPRSTSRQLAKIEKRLAKL